MNKDKIIKDLKERNDKLENQRRQFELRLYHEQHLVEEKDKEIERLKEVIQKNDKEIDNLCKNQKKEIERLNNIIQSINSVCSSMQFSAPENMYVFLQRMIEILDYWKKEKNK